MDDQKIPSYVIRESAIIVCFKMFVLALVFNVLMILVLYLIDYYEVQRDYRLAGVVEFDTLSALVLIILFTIMAVWIFLDWFNRYWFVNDQGMVYRYAILLKKERLYVLKSIDALKIEESYFGKKLGFGDVVIETLDPEPLKVKNITNPEYLVKALESRFGEDLKREIAKKFL